MQRWKRYRRKWRRSIKKRVQRARRSISKRVRKIRNSVRKRLRRFTGIFGRIGNVVRRVRSGMRKVNYFWNMFKATRNYIRRYRPAPRDRIAAY